MIKKHIKAIDKPLVKITALLEPRAYAQKITSDTVLKADKLLPENIRPKAQAQDRAQWSKQQTQMRPESVAKIQK